MATEFNPNSTDAVLATIIVRLDAQDKQHAAKWAEDKASFAAIMAKQDMTNGKVIKLEKWKSRVRGEYVGVAGVVTVLGFLIANWSTLVSFFR